MRDQVVRHAIAAIIAVLTVWQIGVTGSAFAQTATVTASTGQTCAGTRFGSNLNCTSNDFSSTLSFDQPSASALSSCLAGSTVTIDVIGTIKSNSPSRYDIGYFIAENGIDPRLNSTSSQCSIGVTPTTPSPFLNLDGNGCGDFSANQTATLQINGVKVRCTPVTGSNSLAIPYVLVFNNQSGPAICSAATITANTTAKCLSSSTASVTGIIVNGYVTITKNTLPVGQAGTFAFTASETSGATTTPSSFNLTNGASQTVQVPFSSTGGGRTLVISEALLSGWEPTSSITCTAPDGSSSSSYVTVNNAARTISANLTTTNYGALCKITNTKTPTVQLSKVTLGGAYGPFSFTASNLTANPNSITTSVAGTPVASTSGSILVSTIGSPVTLTEGHDLEYFPSGVACTDQNSTLTLQTGTFGSRSGDVLTIPAGNIVAGADIRCTFTNTKSAPNVKLTKTSSVSAISAAGTSISYTLAVTNIGNVIIPTMTLSDILGAVICPSSAGTSITNLAVGATENCSVSYTVPQSVLDNNGGGTGTLLNSASVSGTYGTNSFSASGTKSIPLVVSSSMSIVKTASSTTGVNVGDIVTYQYLVKNTGNVTMTNVKVVDNHNGYGTPPIPGNESLYNDVAPIGDSTDTGANGTWDTFAPGDTVKFTSSYKVVQGDIDLLQ